MLANYKGVVKGGKRNVVVVLAYVAALDDGEEHAPHV